MYIIVLLSKVCATCSQQTIGKSQSCFGDRVYQCAVSIREQIVSVGARRFDMLRHVIRWNCMLFRHMQPCLQFCPPDASVNVWVDLRVKNHEHMSTSMTWEGRMRRGGERDHSPKITQYIRNTEGQPERTSGLQDAPTSKNSSDSRNTYLRPTVYAHLLIHLHCLSSTHILYCNVQYQHIGQLCNSFCNLCVFFIKSCKPICSSVGLHLFVCLCLCAFPLWVYRLCEAVFRSKHIENVHPSTSFLFFTCFFLKQGCADFGPVPRTDPLWLQMDRKSSKTNAPLYK